MEVEHIGPNNTIDRVVSALGEAALTSEEKVFVLNKATDVEHRFYDYMVGIGGSYDEESCFVARIVDDEYRLVGGNRYLPQDDFRRRVLERLGVLTERERISDLVAREDLEHGMLIEPFLSSLPENPIELQRTLERSSKLHDVTLNIRSNIPGVRVLVWHQLPDIVVRIDRPAVIGMIRSLVAVAS
jgi:hypothetical protein